MEPALHLDPDRLRVHAGRLAALVERLAPPPGPPLARTAGSPGAAELDHATSVVGRAVRELSELAAALHGAAARAEDADGDVRARVLREGWDRG